MNHFYQKERRREGGEEGCWSGPGLSKVLVLNMMTIRSGGMVASRNVHQEDSCKRLMMRESKQERYRGVIGEKEAGRFREKDVPHQADQLPEQGISSWVITEEAEREEYWIVRTWGSYSLDTVNGTGRIHGGLMQQSRGAPVSYTASGNTTLPVIQASLWGALTSCFNCDV